MTPEGAATRVKSLEKALEMLALFRGAGKALRVTDVAVQLRLPTSTAHRLLKTLIAHGYVRQSPATREYLAGAALLELAQELAQPTEVARAAEIELRELVARTRESAAICVLHNAEAHFTLSLDGPEVLRVVTLPAHHVAPAHATSGGKLLLAHLLPAALHSLYRSPRLFAYSPRTIVSRAALERDLAAIRKRGYAISREEAHVGVSTVAIGIRDTDGTTVAALSILCPTQRLPQSRVASLVSEMRRTGARISARLPHGRR